jgi:DNA polymerase/3'-5' exonuclease PolX
MLEKFGELYPIREERELFELLGIAWVDPVDRTI